jgi:hypothetical protein
MVPIIYHIIKSNNKPISYSYTTTDSPILPLIKYGHIAINSVLDMVTLTSNPNYKNALHIDLSDPDQQKIFKEIGFDTITLAVLEIWEIISLFNLLDTAQNIYAPESRTHMKTIIEADSKKHKILDKNSGKTDLAIYRCTDNKVNEKLAIACITSVLPGLLAAQKKGSNMVLQFQEITSDLSVQLGFVFSQAIYYA